MSGRKLEFPLIIHCGRKQLLMLCCVVESGETSWSAPMSPVYSSVCTLLRRQPWSPLDTVTRHQLSQSLIWKIIKIFLCFYPDNFPDNWGLVEKLRSVASVSWLLVKSPALSHSLTCYTIFVMIPTKNRTSTEQLHSTLSTSGHNHSKNWIKLNDIQWPTVLDWVKVVLSSHCCVVCWYSW